MPCGWWKTSSKDAHEGHREARGSAYAPTGLCVHILQPPLFLRGLLPLPGALSVGRPEGPEEHGVIPEARILGGFEDGDAPPDLPGRLLEAFLADMRAGLLSWPVFVKPVKGSASIAISRAYDEETVRLLVSHGDEMMIQEFLDGQEIGADCYIDLHSGKTVSVFTKKKLVMRAGETDKAVSFREDRLFALITRFIDEMGLRGQIDIDIFEIGGEYYISEVNPRFGGDYPHAYECGVDHMALIVNNLEGNENTVITGQYEDGLIMMKYNEIMLRKGSPDA